MEEAVVVENVHSDADEVFNRAGVSVLREPGALSAERLHDALGGVTYLGIRSRTHVLPEHVANAPQLRAVGAFCIGTNQIDTAAAARHGVAVFNAPFSNTRSVVELTLANIIALSRKLGDANQAMHAGTWHKTATGCHEIRGRTLGIVGYGNIGSQLSVAAEALGMRVVFYDLADKLALGLARPAASLAELLGESDVVSLHVDGRPENEHLLGATELARVHPGALLCNASRGHVLDTAAVAHALDSGQLGGVAIDVFNEEPDESRAPFSHVLQGKPNTILTPHIGGSTTQAQRDIARYVATKMVDYTQTGSTAMCVNLPQLAPGPVPEGVLRIGYIHASVPGAMAALDRVIADAGRNITGQHLATQGEIGYAITDVAEHPGLEGDEAGLMRGIGELPGHIRSFTCASSR